MYTDFLFSLSVFATKLLEKRTNIEVINFEIVLLRGDLRHGLKLLMLTVLRIDLLQNVSYNFFLPL
jgi:hypothetical protein